MYGFKQVVGQWFNIRSLWKQDCKKDYITMETQLRILITELLLISIISCDKVEQSLEPKEEYNEPYLLSSLEEKCHDDLTGKELLMHISSEYIAILNGKSSKYDSTLKDSIPLTIQATYKGGKIICHPEVEAPPGSLAPDIPAYIEIELEISFFTEDETFKENFTAMVTEYGYFSKSFTTEEICGTYQPNLQGWNNVHVNINGTLYGIETWGSITITGQPPEQASTLSFIAFWDNRQ